jgi:hypothetical protein
MHYITATFMPSLSNDWQVADRATKRADADNLLATGRLNRRSARGE